MNDLNAGAAPRPVIDVWFEFASPYSYITMMRIAPLAAAARLDLRWRPFLLGPIFKAQGWDTTPFKIYPAKGRHFVRDVERVCADLGLPFRWPPTFPVLSLTASRVALVGLAAGWGEAFCRAVYQVGFGEGRDIADRAVIAEVLASLGLEPGPVLEQAGSAAIKGRLREQTDEALRLGIFGAPTFILPDGELFWGNDRLEQALAWAQRNTSAVNPEASRSGAVRNP